MFPKSFKMWFKQVFSLSLSLSLSLRVSCHPRPPSPLRSTFHFPFPRGKLISRLESSHRCLLILPSFRSTASLSSSLLQTDSDFRVGLGHRFLAACRKEGRFAASIFLRLATAEKGGRVLLIGEELDTTGRSDDQNPSLFIVQLSLK